jgi:hypothetical protein
VRINMARATALMHPPVTIGDLELEAQDCSVIKMAGSAEALANLASAGIAPCCR